MKNVNCLYCKHCINIARYNEPRCGHPVTNIISTNNVTGEEYVCRFKYGPHGESDGGAGYGDRPRCGTVRDESGFCGIEGKLFEQDKNKHELTMLQKYARWAGHEGWGPEGFDLVSFCCKTTLIGSTAVVIIGSLFELLRSLPGAAALTIGVFIVVIGCGIAYALMHKRNIVISKADSSVINFLKR